MTKYDNLIADTKYVQCINQCSTLQLFSYKDETAEQGDVVFLCDNCEQDIELVSVCESVDLGVKCKKEFSYDLHTAANHQIPYVNWSKWKTIKNFTPEVCSFECYLTDFSGPEFTKQVNNQKQYKNIFLSVETINTLTENQIETGDYE